MTPRWRSGVAWGLAVMAVAAVFRVPAFLSPRHLGYDDGVYLSSVLLMGEGLHPFRDFFSSQGPVFLPLLRLFDMTGVGGLRAARLAMVATGALIALAAYLLARKDHPPPRAAVAGLLAGSSGTLLMAAGPVQSDGVALAFGLFALLAALGDHQAGPWPAVAAGVLLAMGLATKHAPLAPVALVVVVLVLRRAGRQGLGRFLVSGLAAGALVTLPWDPAAVWEQYVTFHISKPRDWGLWDNAVDLATVVVDGELPLLVLLIAGLALGREQRPWSLPREDHGIPSGLLQTWLWAALVLDLVVTPIELGFDRFAAFLVPPMVLIVLRTPLPTSLALALALVALPYQWITSGVTEVATPTGVESRISALLRSTPEGSLIVTDEQGLAWMARRPVHPEMVYTSFGRIAAASIAREDVATALDDPRVCAYLAGSGRFAALGLDAPPPRYQPVLVEDETVLAVRTGCPSASRVED